MNDEEGDVKKVDWVGSVEKERRQLRREIDAWEWKTLDGRERR